MTDLEIKKTLNQYVETLRENDKEFNKFFSMIEEESETFYILGGSLRELYFNNSKNIRDIDIITKGLDIEKLEIFKYKKNRFGSYKIIFKTIDVDIWDFKENWGYKNNIINKESTLSDLSKGTFFNIDSLIIDYKKQLLEKTLFKKADRFKTIDFTIKNKKLINLNPCPEINILRLLINSEKYNLKFSKNIKKYIRNYLKEDFDLKLNEIYKSQFRHYNQEKIKIQELKKRLKRIEK